jgi:hypothetical protein
VHSLAVEIWIDPSPPLAVNEEGWLAIDSWHLSDVGEVTDVDADVQPVAKTPAKTAGSSAALLIVRRIGLMITTRCTRLANPITPW